MKVPFVDVQRVNARFRAEFEQAFARVASSGRYLFGAETEAFEDEYAAMCGIAHCVGVASGLDALSLSLKAWISLGRLAVGDEVIVPANSFVASALAVTESGLRVRFVDADPYSFNISVASVRAELTSGVRAVMPVHLYGRLADTQDLRSLCDLHGLLMLEDAAQAHGARASGVVVGNDAAGFSFYPAKNLGALGDAGCVVTNDAQLARRVRALGNYGSTTKYQHDLRGTNSRLDELQAALLRVRLAHLEADNERRRAVARRYIDGISHPLVQLPNVPKTASSSVWHLFVVQTPERAALSKYLESREIETLVHYPCAIHRQPAFRAEFGHLALPVSEHLQNVVLSLPISPVLENDQIDYVIETVNGWPARERSPSK